jgi:glutamate 5-kinase
MTHVTTQPITAPNLSKPLKRLVIKIGSSLLVEDGALRNAWLQSVIADINALRHHHEILIVTSGSIALGRSHLGYGHQKLKIDQKQAAAACGQIALMQAYQNGFSAHQIVVAQILLTIEDSENRQRYLNARNTLTELLAQSVIPIINENDTVAISEIRFGDNDRLAAKVAQMVDADGLIILSDIDGLYTANPRQHLNALHLPLIEHITPEIEQMAGGAGSTVGTGGMITKIMAAKLATPMGCHVAITSGLAHHPLNRLQQGVQRATWFTAKNSPISARKQWIASSLAPLGTITINPCAVTALNQGSSLLPIGVVDIQGQFTSGDTISIIDEQGIEHARGLVSYGSSEARLMMGRHSHDVFHIIGPDAQEELIHRDNLVLLSNTIPKTL